MAPPSPSTKPSRPLSKGRDAASGSAPQQALAAASHVRVPDRQPFRTLAQDDAEAHALAAVPPSRVMQSRAAGGKNDLFHAIQAAKFFRIPTGRAGYVVHLGAD